MSVATEFPNPPRRPVLSYLLRLWAEDDAGQPVWRVSLTPIGAQPEPPRGFASLAAAVAFLEAEMGNSER